MGEHRLTEYHTVGKLLCCDTAVSRTLAIVTRIFPRFRITAEIRMALRTEPIEGTTHIKFLLRVHVEECQIHGAATGMTAPFVDILLFEENALVEVGIEI